VKLDSALGDIEFAGDFLVGKILEKRIENSCSRRLRLVTESVFRRRPWLVRMESTKPESTDAGPRSHPVKPAAERERAGRALPRR